MSRSTIDLCPRCGTPTHATEGTSEGYCAPCFASILAAENQAMRVALVGAKEALEYVLGWNPVTWSAETARDRCRTAIRHATQSLEIGR